MKLAVDVCIGNRGIKKLREAGHDVVVVAEHAESDRDWFARALAAGAEVIVSADRDLEILAYDQRIKFVRAKNERRGTENALRVIHKLQSWVRPRRST